ncbi:MAG: D-alanyl-D-alanine carboxypeptidase, partial [bacterium]
STFSFNQNMIKIQKKNNGFIIYPPVFDELRDYNKLVSIVSNLREIDGAFWYIYPSPPEYNKRVIKKIFKDLGYDVNVKFLENPINKDVEYLGSFPTATLLESLRYQNFWSDNFVAQQIYNKLKYEINFDFSQYYKDYGVIIDDGCGLSRKNRISAYFLAELLSKADDFGLLDYLIFTLPGYNEGTLEKRDLPPTVKAKTGTLNDVSSLAGYIKTLKGKWYSFAIIYNGPNVYNAKLNEEKILNYVYKNW